MENDKSLFSSCDEIPFINKEMNTIEFSEEKGNGKSLDIIEILEYILNNKIFLKKCANKNIRNNAYICKEHKNNYYSYCIDCKVNICEKCRNNKHYNHKIFDFNIKNKNFFEFLDKILYIKISHIKAHIIKSQKEKFNNYIKNDNMIQENNELISKIFILYIDLKWNFILFIYLNIIKRIICEQILMNKTNLFNYYIYKNILDFYEKYLLKKKKIEKNHKLQWIIDFHSKEEKNENNKYIYIGINLDGYVIIYLFHKHKNRKNQFIINYEKIDFKGGQRIYRLVNCYNANDKINYYFLINSFIGHKSVIIKITANYQSIEIIETINFNKGLSFCNEIQYKNNYYLLIYCDGNFNLCYYDYKDKKLKYKPIEEKSENNQLNIINDNYEKNSFKIINFIEKIELIVVQINSSEPSLNFYKLEEFNDNFYIVLNNKIKISEGQNNFSWKVNNCCVIKNKYLIIGAHSIKNNKNGKRNYGGFYVIDLEKEKYDLNKYIYIKNSDYVKSIVNFENNIFICNNAYSFYSKKQKIKIKGFELLSFRIIEGEKGEFQIKKIDKLKGGDYFSINCKGLLHNCFIISSGRIEKKNSITLIKKKGFFLFKKYISLIPYVSKKKLIKYSPF